MLLGVTHPEGVVAMLLVVTTLHAMGTRITSGLIGRPLGSYHGPDFAYLLLRSQAVKRCVWCLFFIFRIAVPAKYPRLRL